jgi:hypothetical protein
MQNLGSQRMPPLASQQVDYAALEIINAWINTLPACD